MNIQNYKHFMERITTIKALNRWAAFFIVLE